jgi:hypothetical protein
MVATILVLCAGNIIVVSFRHFLEGAKGLARVYEHPPDAHQLEGNFSDAMNIYQPVLLLPLRDFFQLEIDPVVQDYAKVFGRHRSGLRIAGAHITSVWDEAFQRLLLWSVQ